MGYTVEFADHTHNWYPVAVEGEPPTDEWVCIVQGCGYRIMPPAVLAAYVRARVAEALRSAADEVDEVPGTWLPRPHAGCWIHFNSDISDWLNTRADALPAPDPESGQ